MQLSLFVNVPIGSSSSTGKFIKWNENKELLNKPYWSSVSTTLGALLKCPSIFNFTSARKGKGTSLVHLEGWKKSLTSNYQIIFLNAVSHTQLPCSYCTRRMLPETRIQWYMLSWEPQSPCSSLILQPPASFWPEMVGVHFKVDRISKQRALRCK